MKARMLVLVLLVGAASAGATEKVVLSGGKVLEVESAVVKGSSVHVTYASGQMQAYAVDEVDLAASGLAPAAAPAGAADEPQRSQSIADAATKGDGASSVTITDQDVSHVRGSAAAAGEDAEEASPEEVGAAAALLITNLSQQLAGSMVNLTGNVNNTGTKSVSSITLEAQAVDQAGEVVGSGATTIAQPLTPKGQVGFTLSFPVDGPVADIRVRAVAAVAAFDFSARPAPAVEDAAQ